MSDEQTFLYDDFFTDEADQGQEVIIKLAGRDVPIRMKTRLSVKDKEEAQAKAVEKRVDQKKGTIEIVGVDDARLAGEILSRVILEWPFTYKSGAKVPITPDTCMRINAQAEDQLLKIVKLQEEAQAQAHAAFPASDNAEPQEAAVAE